VAKKRRPTRSTRRASSGRGSARRKTAKKKAARKLPPRAKSSLIEPARSLNLKVLRGQLALVLSGLSKRRGSTPELEAKLDDTRRRISQWMTDIDDICTPEEEEICGSTMEFPFP